LECNGRKGDLVEGGLEVLKDLNDTLKSELNYRSNWRS